MSAARFDVDLRSGIPVPPAVLAEARAAAHAAGFAAGWAQGQQESAAATQQLHEAIAAEAGAAMTAQQQATRRAVAAIGAAAAALEQRVLATATDLEDLILTTALDIAEAVIGRELEVAASPGRDALARALELAPANRPVTVRLNAADHGVLAAANGGASEIEAGGRIVTIVPDPQLRPGDAVAQCDATSIDARISTALDRIRKVLA